MIRLYSERSLARILGISRETLENYVRDADSMYSPFVDRSAAKSRMIDRPHRELSEVQRSIYDVFLKNYHYSDYAFGGVPGRSLNDAVERHSSRPLLVRVDVRNFYPSITDRAVFQVWRRLGQGTRVASILTRLTTYNRRLPQGAPTSMALANIYMEPTDSGIFSTLSLTFPDIRYSRYVDDMIFSGVLDAAVVLGVAARHLRAAGLQAHRAREKRRVMPSDARQEVLGMVVNSRVSLPRRRKRLVRAIVHTAKKFGGDRDSVQGHIAYLRTHHASLADQLEDSLMLAPLMFTPRRHNATNSTSG